MKKFTLFLSMIAVAAGSAMADVPVAGTAEAPNYYVIKANRGIPYLTYSAEELTANTDGVTTHLFRSDALAPASVWAVTPGTAEGTVHIKSYVADAYFMVLANAAENGLNAVGQTSETPVDMVLPEAANGAFGIALADESAMTYRFLDATGGNSAYCGNWIANDAGTMWWFTQINVAEGQTMEEALAATFLTPMVEEAVAAFNNYKPLVPPAVSDVIDAAIAAVQAVQPSANAIAEFNEVYATQMANVKNALTTALNGGTYAIKNVRRAAENSQYGSYLYADAATGKFPTSDSFGEDVAHFTFKSVENGGYIIYNAATESYIGEGMAAVAAEESATAVYPFFAKSKDYYGVSMPFAADHSGQGMNIDTNGNPLTTWSCTDDGSMWAIVDCSTDGIVAAAAAAVEEALAPYAATVAPVAEILNKAIADAKALEYSDDVVERAQAIKTQALADANALLATGLANKNFNLKILRNDNFLAATTEAINYVHTTTLDANAVFTFEAAADGGYYLHSAVNGYVGPTEEREEEVWVTAVEDVASAVVVYPFLNANGGFSGISLGFNADGSGDGLNMNRADGLHTYLVADGGSIWGLTDAVEDSINSIVAEKATVMEGIYDLSGRKLAAPVRGINIINGKKVLVK